MHTCVLYKRTGGEKGIEREGEGRGERGREREREGEGEREGERERKINAKLSTITYSAGLA